MLFGWNIHANSSGSPTKAINNSLLLREYIVNSGKIGKYIFMEDVCANEKGYKMLYEIQKRGR